MTEEGVTVPRKSKYLNTLFGSDIEGRITFIRGFYIAALNERIRRPLHNKLHPYSLNTVAEFIHLPRLYQPGSPNLIPSDEVYKQCINEDGYCEIIDELEDTPTWQHYAEALDVMVSAYDDYTMWSLKEISRGDYVLQNDGDYRIMDWHLIQDELERKKGEDNEANKPR